MKNKKIASIIAAITLIVVIVFGAISCESVKTKAFADSVELSGTSKSAYLIDTATGTVLYEKNSLEHLPIASMVKIMTLLVSFEQIESGKASYDDDVYVSELAGSMGGSQAFLDSGASYKLNDLLKTIVVASANDSCVAVGEHLFGSVEGLVAEMNNRKESLNLTNTHYVNCTGLPVEGQYSCAHDAAVIFAELIKFPKFFEFACEWMYDFVHPSGRITGLTNTNKLVRFYEGCDGGKTGYTSEAGSCLTATAKRGDMRVIAVAIGAENSKKRNKEISDMFNYAFANYSSKPVILAGQEVERVKVDRSKQDFMSVVAERDYSVFGKKGEKREISYQLVLDNIRPPVAKGDKVGRIDIIEDGKVIASINAVSADDINGKTYLDDINDLIALW